MLSIANEVDLFVFNFAAAYTYISINVNDDSTCDIKQRTQAVELLSKTSIIVWDEAPMAHRNCFETVDCMLRDILKIEDP